MTSKICPKCSKPLALKHRRSDNKPFYGCMGFPACRYTEDAASDASPNFKNVTPSPVRNWSTYQQACFDFVEHGSGNAVVIAVAGSGKTTTLEHMIALVSPDLRLAFLAFNKGIARELQTRIAASPNRSISTLHSLGYSNIRAFNSAATLEEHKVDMIWRDITAATDSETFATLDEWRGDIQKIASLLRATLSPLDRDSVAYIADRYNVAVNDDNLDFITEWACRLVNRCRATTDLVDFDDMIDFPAVGIVAVSKTFDWVLVDEAQDLNKAQIALVLKSVAENGRVLAVGDSHQCHPAGTLISMTGGGQKAIEDVQIGDQVVSYYTQKSYFPGTHTQGRKVLDKAVRHYEGEMLTLSAGHQHLDCTPNHRCLVKMKPGKYYLLYMMIKGNQARIGITRNSHPNASGLAMRARQEHADSAWILAAYDTLDEARSKEIITQATFGLPSLIFQSTTQPHMMQQEFIDRTYSYIGDNLDRAQACLTHFGREFQYPAWSKDFSNVHMGSKSFITQACNLISGYMMVRTFDNTPRGGRWEIVTTKIRPFSGDVYSLSVESTTGGKRLYIANRIAVHNSIYGFRGADTSAIPNLIEALDAQTLPLSITYRCPASHVALAKQFVPTLEARPNAPDGVLDSIPFSALVSIVQPGDLVMCRTNAPLVGPCFALIAAGIKATIQGRDIGSGLISLIDKVSRKAHANSLGDFLYALGEYRDQQIYKLTAAKKASLAATIDDQTETIIALAATAATIDDLVFRIQSVFDDNAVGVKFSSVHKAKGLEAERTFILRPDLLPHPMATSDWEVEQEMNIIYVALTRSKSEMYFVSQDGKAGISIADLFASDTDTVAAFETRNYVEGE